MSYIEATFTVTETTGTNAALINNLKTQTIVSISLADTNILTLLEQIAAHITNVREYEIRRSEKMKKVTDEPAK
jgi:hypothetical protein